MVMSHHLPRPTERAFQSAGLGNSPVGLFFRVHVSSEFLAQRTVPNHTIGTKPNCGSRCPERMVRNIRHLSSLSPPCICRAEFFYPVRPLPASHGLLRTHVPHTHYDSRRAQIWGVPFLLTDVSRPSLDFAVFGTMTPSHKQISIMRFPESNCSDQVRYLPCQWRESASGTFRKFRAAEKARALAELLKSPV